LQLPFENGFFPGTGANPVQQRDDFPLPLPDDFLAAAMMSFFLPM